MSIEGLLSTPAPVDGELETTRQEQIWLREMFDEKAPRFTAGEIAGTEEVLQRYHRDFDKLLAENARRTALLAAEKAALAECDKLAVHHSFRADEAEARAEQAEAALAVEREITASLARAIERGQAPVIAARVAAEARAEKAEAALASCEAHAAHYTGIVQSLESTVADRDRALAASGAARVKAVEALKASLERLCQAGAINDAGHLVSLTYVIDTEIEHIRAALTQGATP